MKNNSKNFLSDPDNLSLDVYGSSDFVNQYSNKIEYNSHNALYERPATLALLGNVKGKKILDAGCGPGVYASVLSDKGAEVTAIDYSDEMIKLTKERTDHKVKAVKANLNFPLDFLNDNEFDAVISSLTIHYVKDLRSLFSEFNRVLKINGELVISTHHPFLDHSFHPDGNYFETELITDEWTNYNVEMKFYRRPLSELFNLFIETDFRITELSEPQPLKECEVNYPDTYKTLSSQPWFIFFKAIKER